MRLLGLKTLLKYLPIGPRSFISFRPYLTDICCVLKPRRVLEFGPGISTKIILQSTGASIVSVELSHDWAEKCRREIRSERFTLIEKKPDWDLREIQELGPPFDLILVDGGDRVAELMAIPPYLSAKGVVFLHDAHREDYESGIRNYPFIFFPERHSAIMTKDKNIDRRLREHVRTNYTCRCRYCNTQRRNEYLAQFI